MSALKQLLITVAALGFCSTAVFAQTISSSCSKMHLDSLAELQGEKAISVQSNGSSGVKEFIARKLSVFPKSAPMSIDLPLEKWFGSLPVYVGSNGVFHVKSFNDLVRISSEVSGEKIADIKIKRGEEEMVGVFEHPTSPGGLVIITEQKKTNGGSVGSFTILGRKAIVVDASGNVSLYKISESGLKPRFGLQAAGQYLNGSVAVGLNPETQEIILATGLGVYALTANPQVPWYQRVFN